jgi:diacylglycerol kinase family enzyme
MDKTGTVRKVVKQLLKKQSNFDFPIAIVPAGTANNIAKSLGVNSDLESQVKTWKSGRTTSFDIGLVESGSDSNFFLESFGCGLFSRLMKEMKNVPTELTSSPDKKIKKGLEVMLGILSDYVPAEYIITVDGKSFNGSYLMVEALNIKSLGPNLLLAPEADFQDGCLDLVVVEASQKQALVHYIKKRLNNEHCAFDATVIRGSDIIIQSKTDDQHLDDKISDKAHESIRIRIYEKQIKFLTAY